jgi:Protein of unknown function (DUF1648)
VNVTEKSARSRYLAMTSLMWVALPLIAFRYWQAWDQLPARMVTHFGANGQPNGWMTPRQSLTFSLVLVGILLAIFTGILLYALRRTRKVDATVWALMGFFYVIISVVAFICDSVLQYNLSQAPIHIGLIGAVIFASGLIFLTLFLSAQRGSVLPAATVISEETHSSRSFALVFLVPIAAMIVAAITVPIPGVKLTLVAAALVMISAAAMAWDGFHYLFSPAGVEVRTLGFRLRSIYTAEIQSYVADRWNASGGYGIRGLGDRRAYVWGNRGVRIQTAQGEVFLGHPEPEKIVRDLDFVTNHKGHEGTQRF